MKQGQAVLGTIVIIIVILIFIGWLANQGWKECRNENDCKKNQYCGSDFGCHDFQVVEKVVKSDSQSNYEGPAWVIGISLIIAAMIMKWETIFGKKKKKKKEEKEEESKEEDLSYSYKAEDECLYEDHCNKME